MCNSTCGICRTNISSSLKLKFSTTQTSIATLPCSIQEASSAQMTAGSIPSNNARAELSTLDSGFVKTVSITGVKTSFTTCPPISQVSRSARDNLLTRIGSAGRPSCATRSFRRPLDSERRPYCGKYDGSLSGPRSQVYSRRFSDISRRRTTLIALNSRRSRFSGELRS